MWPWEHLAIGYLLYSAYVNLVNDAPPTAHQTMVVAFATQFPDLVDKPLAWTVSVLASGRSLAHSLLTAVVVCGFVVWYARRTDHSTIGVAFAVGYLSHPFADGMISFVAGDFPDLTYLVWPLLDLPPYETEQSFAAHLLSIEVTPFFLFQLVLVALALVVWDRDGRPGLAALRGWLLTWRERATRQ